MILLLTNLLCMCTVHIHFKKLFFLTTFYPTGFKQIDKVK